MESTQIITEANNKPRIFISYKRDVAPDQFIAEKLFQIFKDKGFDPFIDQTMPIGTDWAMQIEQELARSNFLVVLLSKHSVNSEMVKGEISTAHRLGKEFEGKPKILPIRIAYREPFKYPLSAYLDPLNWGIWDSSDDTPRLIGQLTQAITGGELGVRSVDLKISLVGTGENKLIEPVPDAQPTLGKSLPLGADPNAPEGPESKFYIERYADRITAAAIKADTATISIKGPEQIGKSSLLFKTLFVAQEAGKKVAFIDFQLFDNAVLKDANQFYRIFCSNISDEIEVEDKTHEFWQKYSTLGNVLCTTRYMSDHLLKAIGDSTLVLAMDRVEDILHLDFRGEFFRMLRNWHERRGTPNPRIREIWRKFNMVLVTSTEPWDLIDDPRSSPFNVGEIVELKDFSPEQVMKLNELYNYPLTKDQVKDLTTLLCGHPYLVRRALWLLATERVASPEELFSQADNEYGPFGDHLRYHLFNLLNMCDGEKKQKFINELRQMVIYKKPLDEMTFHHLRGAGIVRGEFKEGKFRCQLYERYFERHFSGNNLQ